MPLLLRGLDLPDNEIRASVIDTLFAAATAEGADSTVVTEHASSLVTTMLKNSLVSHMPSVVRRAVSSLRSGHRLADGAVGRNVRGCAWRPCGTWPSCRAS